MFIVICMPAHLAYLGRLSVHEFLTKPADDAHCVKAYSRDSVPSCPKKALTPKCITSVSCTWTLPSSIAPSEIENDLLYQEIAALAAAGAHPSIVRYYFAWMETQGDGVHFYIQLERCGTSLAQRACVDLEPFKEAELLEILKQV